MHRFRWSCLYSEISKYHIQVGTGIQLFTALAILFDHECALTEMVVLVVLGGAITTRAERNDVPLLRSTFLNMSAI